MICRFAGFELDAGNHELKASGEDRLLQPQALAVLEHMLRHRDRVVSKLNIHDSVGKWPEFQPFNCRTNCKDNSIHKKKNIKPLDMLTISITS